jgi:hypothetical protein
VRAYFWDKDAFSGHLTPFESEEQRSARRGIVTAETRVCDLFLDADWRFLQAWGGSTGTQEERVARAVFHMVNVVHAAHVALLDNFGPQLTVTIAGLRVHTADNLPSNGTTIVSASAMLRGYQQWLGAGVRAVQQGAASARGASSPTASDVCLNLLFTHVNLDGIVGSSESSGPTSGIGRGFCAQALTGSGESLNSLFVSSLLYRSPLPVGTLVKALTHELGHAFGADHPCCKASSCPAGTSCTEFFDPVCNPRNRNFVMFPFITNSVNSLVFSDCSRQSIRSALLANGQCLYASNPCRHGGACCHGNKLRPQGTICTPAQPGSCWRASQCTGQVSYCPAPVPLDDGSPCIFDSMGPGTCRQGTCLAISTDRCKALAGTACSLTNSPCTAACRVNGTCVALALDRTWERQWVNRTRLCFAAANSSGADGASSSTGALGRCQGSVCLATQSIEWCQWRMEAQFSGCSASCGGGVRVRTPECLCANGTIDSTGLMCKRVRPLLVTEACNPQPCPTCTGYNMTGFDGGLGWLNGLYTGGGSGSGGQAVFSRADVALHLYHMNLYGRGWWVISATVGSAFRWLAYADSEGYTEAPFVGTATPQAWLGQADRTYRDLPAVRVLCACDGPGMVPDEAQQRCVYADAMVVVPTAAMESSGVGSGANASSLLPLASPQDPWVLVSPELCPPDTYFHNHECFASVTCTFGATSVSRDRCACPPQCIDCALPSGQCFTCGHFAFLFNGTCWPECPANTLSVGTEEFGRRCVRQLQCRRGLTEFGDPCQCSDRSCLSCNLRPVGQTS